MLWQQAIAAGTTSGAKQPARPVIQELQKLETDFNAGRPLRNKATPKP
jgi:hypothetical protein